MSSSWISRLLSGRYHKLHDNEADAKKDDESGLHQIALSSIEERTPSFTGTVVVSSFLITTKLLTHIYVRCDVQCVHETNPGHNLLWCFRDPYPTNVSEIPILRVKMSCDCTTVTGQCIDCLNVTTYEPCIRTLYNHPSSGSICMDRKLEQPLCEYLCCG